MSEIIASVIMSAPVPVSISSSLSSSSTSSTSSSSSSSDSTANNYHQTITTICETQSSMVIDEDEEHNSESVIVPVLETSKQVVVDVDLPNDVLEASDSKLEENIDLQKTETVVEEQIMENSVEPNEEEELPLEVTSKIEDNDDGNKDDDNLILDSIPTTTTTITLAEVDNKMDVDTVEQPQDEVSVASSKTEDCGESSNTSNNNNNNRLDASITDGDASLAAAIAAAEEPQSSRRSSNHRSCKKKGILGVPQTSKMLFMFNSKELWPDDNEDGDGDSDEDYQPIQSGSGITSSSKRPPASASKRRRSIVTGGEVGNGKTNVITTDSGTEDGEDEDFMDNEDDDESLASISTTSSADSTPIKKQKITNKTKQKNNKKKKSSTPIKKKKVVAPSAKKSTKKSSTTKSPAKAKKSGTKQKKSGKKAVAASAAAASPAAKKSKKKKRKPYEESYIKARNHHRSSNASNATASGDGSNNNKATTVAESSLGLSAATAGSGGGGGGTNSKLQNGTTGFVDFGILLKLLKYNFQQILPQDILIKVFLLVLELEDKRTQTLLKLSQVCDEWRQIILSTPILWQRLDLSGFSDDKFPMGTFQLLNDDYQLFSSVRELDLSRWNGPNAEKIIQIVAASSNFDLELLSVKNCRNISSNFLQTVISNCRKLKSLDISAITSTSHQNCQNPFAAPIFRPLLENCGPNLVSLFMSENMMPSFPTCISIIMECCHNLEVIDVSNVASLGARLTSIPIEKLQLSCPKLRILRAANVNFATSPSTVTPGFPKLEELSIPFHENFMVPISILSGHSDAIIEQLTKASENLTLLDVRGARYITPRGLVKIPTWSLKHLSMSNCPKLEHDTLEMVFTKWNKSLVDVDLSWNKSESCVNACIGTLCDVVDEENVVESPLTAIQLRGSALSYHSLKLLLNKCCKLSSIDLQSCRGLPRGIKRSYADEEFSQFRNDILQGKYD